MDTSLAVPKIAKERTQENQRRIEAAALELFTSQGFHGTNNREIAEKVGVSTGTIYTYFPSKEAIFSSLAQRYRLHINEWLRKAVSGLQEPLSRQGLMSLASEVQGLMYDDSESFLMLLSDVIEFKNQHFLEVFHDVPEQFRRLLGPVLEKVKDQPGWRGEDPAFVLASIHVYFFTFFLMERHMQGEQHLGISNELATEKFIDLLFRGLWTSPPGDRSAGSPGKTREYILQQPTLRAERDRVDYLRFLSGRLWSSPPDAPPNQSKENGGHPAKRPILFLPEIPRERIDENQLRIEAAALELFTHQGFHGTNIRDIAEKARVSQGAIYMYYPSKEAIFEGLVRSYRYSMRKFMERVFRALEDPFSRSNLRLFAAAMRSMVYEDAEYWLLMYIDVIEFKNQHFLKAFQDIPEQFRRLLGPKIDTVKEQPGWCGHDPALVMAIIYFYFHTYFVIEAVMHGNHHLGISDDEAVERFIDILLNGLWETPAGMQSVHSDGKSKKSRRIGHEYSNGVQ
ncbi:MAG TPA: TetR/AcrR family transcriptional regulator [Candidatus Angelobacter sp.]|jgi:AcrR family transcriptional regulator|nr:TetR/AcrR family transcriptional regulator [Candidatus Angelobacter sp.]